MNKKLVSINIEAGNADSSMRSNAILSQKRDSIVLLGQELITDTWMEWRVKWGQRGVGLFTFVGVICHAFSGGSILPLRIAALVSGTFALLFCILLYYKNKSLAMVRRLLKETNVVIIVSLTICNLIINIGMPTTSLSPVNAFMYMLVINAYLFIDAVIVKSRYMVIFIGLLFILLNFSNLYGNTLGTWDTGKVLIQYSIQGKNYTFMKRHTHRQIYSQILLFSANAVYTMIADKEMKLMIFATGHVRRDEVFKPHSGYKKTQNRIRWAQRGVGVSTVLGLACFFASSGVDPILRTITVAFGAFGIFCVCLVYYKNFSSVLFKRLIKEPNVIIIMGLSIYNLVVEMVTTTNSLTPVLAVVYCFVVNAFLFMDALVIKSRSFVISVGALTVLLNLFNLLQSTIGDWNVGVVLFDYSYNGYQYKIMKRQTQQSLFSQFLLFAANAVYTMIVDKKMEVLMFVRRNIYRRSGTTSEEVDDRSFARKVKRDVKRVLSSRNMMKKPTGSITTTTGDTSLGVKEVEPVIHVTKEAFV